MEIIEVKFNKSRYHLVNEMIDWCYTNIGDGGWLAAPENKWAVESAFGNTFFKFKNEKDATIFALKWS